MSGKALAAGGSKPAASALPLTILNSSCDKALAFHAQSAANALNACVSYADYDHRILCTAYDMYAGRTR